MAKATPAPAATFVQPVVPAQPPAPAPAPTPPATPAAAEDPFSGVQVFTAESFKPAKAPVPVSPTVLALAQAVVQNSRVSVVTDGWDKKTMALFRRQITAPACETLYGTRKLRLRLGTVDGKAALLISLSEPAPATPAA